MLHTLCPMRYELITLCAMPYAPCSLPFALCHLRLALLIFGRFLSPVKEGAMFTPWNVYPVKSDRYFTGACPVCPACPVAPEDGTGVAPKDGTGVGSGNPTGVEFFLFLSRSMLYAPCAMLVTPLGLYCSKKKSFQKLH